ncbi:MAG TPA: Ig-like domain repeat protein, partial [Gemmatimonadales bacterium]
MLEGANYLYPADYQEDGTGPYHPAFDPAPSVKLRASGTPCGLQVRLVKAIIDANGEETGIAAVANSEIELTNAGGSVYSSVLSLVKGGVYRPQVRKVSCSGAAPTGTITSIDLELAQESSHPDGIARTVGYYPSLSDGVDVDLTNQNVPLNFRFRAPERNVPKATGAWAVSAKRVTGTGSYSVGLYNHTRASQVALSAPILDYTIGGSAPFDFEVAEVDSLPAAGDELDTVVSPAAGTTVHAWSSYLQVNYRLADLDAPTITVPFAATQTHISPGVSPGAQDSVTFSATLWDFSLVRWQVKIENASGAVAESEEFAAPGSSSPAIDWTWDGRYDTTGAVVPDGAYTARLTLTDEPGNVTAATLPIVVDTVAPTVTGFASNVARFGPNSSPNAATFSASVNEQVAWSLSIAKGAWSSTFTGTANATSPVSKVWNAVPNGGDGTYAATLTSTDLAGNPTVTTASVIYDATGPVVSSFAASNPAFSPNADGLKDSTTISAWLADDWTPISWTLQIKQGSTVVKTATGTGNVSYVWDGRDATGGVVADGSYTANLTASDAGNNVRVPSALSITVDTVAPTIDPASIWPPAGFNTVYLSQPLQAAVTDERSGLDASNLRFIKTDVTNESSPTSATHTASLSGGKMVVSSASLTADHSYVLRAEAFDLAGNKGIVEQDRAFRAISRSVNAPTAEIPSTPCVVSSNINVATQTRDVTCENVPLYVDATTVNASSSIHGGDTAFVDVRVPLDDAVLATSVAGVEQTKPAYSPGATSKQSLVYHVPAPASSAISLPVPGEVDSLGTLQTTVPAIWTSASVRMTPVSSTLLATTCSAPAASPCTPDPFQQRFRVNLQSGQNAAQVMASHGTTYEVDGYETFASPNPGYVGAVPPRNLTSIDALSSVTSITLDLEPLEVVTFEATVPAAVAGGPYWLWVDDDNHPNQTRTLMTGAFPSGSSMSITVPTSKVLGRSSPLVSLRGLSPVTEQTTAATFASVTLGLPDADIDAASGSIPLGTPATDVVTLYHSAAEALQGHECSSCTTTGSGPFSFSPTSGDDSLALPGTEDLGDPNAEPTDSDLSDDLVVAGCEATDTCGGPPVLSHHQEAGDCSANIGSTTCILETRDIPGVLAFRGMSERIQTTLNRFKFQADARQRWDVGWRTKAGPFEVSGGSSTLQTTSGTDTWDLRDDCYTGSDDADSNGCGFAEYPEDDQGHLPAYGRDTWQWRKTISTYCLTEFCSYVSDEEVVVKSRDGGALWGQSSVMYNYKKRPSLIEAGNFGSWVDY